MTTDDMRPSEESGKKGPETRQYFKNSPRSALATEQHSNGAIREVYQFDVNDTALTDASLRLESSRETPPIESTSENGLGKEYKNGRNLSAVPRMHEPLLRPGVTRTLGAKLGLLGSLGLEATLISDMATLEDEEFPSGDYTWTSTVPRTSFTAQDFSNDHYHDHNDKRDLGTEGDVGISSSMARAEPGTEPELKGKDISRGETRKERGTTDKAGNSREDDSGAPTYLPRSGYGFPKEGRFNNSRAKQTTDTSLGDRNDESNPEGLAPDADSERLEMSLQKLQLVDDSSVFAFFDPDFYLIGIGTGPTQCYSPRSLPAIFDCITADLFALFQDGGDANFTQCAGKSNASGTSQSLHSFMPTTRQGGLDNAQKRQTGDEDDASENDGDPNQPKKRKMQKASSDALKSVMLACPFNKRDPQVHCHKACVNGKRGISKVKEHLYRTHRVENACWRCNSTFKDEEALKTHAKLDRGCGVSPEQFISGFSATVEKELRSKKKNGRKLTEEERWFDIYRLLFPGFPLPVDPYPEVCTTPTNGWMHYHKFSENYLPALVEKDFDKAFAELLPDPEYRLVLKTTILSVICEKQRQVAAVYEAQEYNRGRSNSEGGSDVAVAQQDTSEFNAVTLPSTSSTEAKKSDTLRLHSISSMEFSSTELPTYGRHRLSSSSDYHSPYMKEPITPRHAASEELDSTYGSAAPCVNSECHGCHMCTGYKHHFAPPNSQQKILSGIAPLDYEQPQSSFTSGTNDQTAALLDSTDMDAFLDQHFDIPGISWESGDYFEGQ